MSTPPQDPQDRDGGRERPDRGGPGDAPGAPQYGQQPPQYGEQSGQQPPQYGQSGQQPPQYGQQSGQAQSGQQPPQYGQPQYGQPQYGQPQYGQPQYGQPYGGAPPTNALAIASLVAGVLAILTVCLWGVPGIVLGLVAIALAVPARRRARAGTAGQGGVARAGLITGIVGLVLGVVVVVLVAVGISLFGDTVEACADLPVEQQQACIEDQLGG